MKSNLRIIIQICLVVLYCENIKAQDVIIDSLKRNLNTVNGKDKIPILLEISSMSFQFNLDYVYKYSKTKLDYSIK